MTQKIIESIETLLASHQPEGLAKIQSKMEGSEQIDQKLFFYLFAICSRWFDAKTVDVNASSYWQKKDAFGILPTWQWPSLARLYILLLVAERNTKEDYIHLYKTLFNSADVQESIVLIQSLAFVPQSEAFVEKAREAARSNITTMFIAVAHNSNYAFNYFDESGWNQLVLKAAFLNVAIVKIYGLKSRNNTQLVKMLCDYASERQVASRSVPWDLWCCVAWAANSEENYQYLKTQFARGDIKTKAAIALALMENQNEHAATLGQQLSQNDELRQMPNPLTWEIISTYNAT